MNIWGPICVLICMIAIPVYYWHRLFRKDPVYTRRWLITWTVKAVVLPILFWMLLNAGSNPVLPALVRAPRARPLPNIYLMGPVPAALAMRPAPPPTKPGFFEGLKTGTAYVLIQSGPAMVSISSFWAALTLGWLLPVVWRRVEDRDTLMGGGLFWGLFLVPVGAVMLLLFGLGGVSFTLLFWLCPVAWISCKLQEKPPHVPGYARAVASMKFGKYRAAEIAIINELEKCETDFDGWMMLAGLYATQFGDLDEAERTIHSLCDDPATSLSQVSVALNRLADWQLQFRQDPEAARRALEEVCRRLPGTHLARMAAVRMQKLPATSFQWKEQQRARTIHMPALSDSIDEAPAADASPADPDRALAAANDCVDKLKRDPNDVATREKLAAIFAEQLNQAALAIEQLELLIAMPEQPDAKLAEWLALAAAWQIKYRGDAEAARHLLEQIVRQHPQSAHAFAAQRRLRLMDAETRGRRSGANPPGGTLAADEAG